MSGAEQATIGSDEKTIHLERSFQAPPEEVFDAWTNPEVLRRWWSVQESWRTPVAEVDLRVGGGYRLSMEDPDTGARHTVLGECREIRRPELLVYSWRWELDAGGTGHESLVTVRFQGDEGGTNVELVHSGLEDAGSAERHAAGWRACIENLGGTVLGSVAHEG